MRRAVEPLLGLRILRSSRAQSVDKLFRKTWPAAASVEYCAQKGAGRSEVKRSRLIPALALRAAETLFGSRTQNTVATSVDTLFVS